MIILGIIIGLLISAVLLGGLIYFQSNQEVVREIKKLLPKPKGAIIMPHTQAELDRDKRIEEAQARGEAIPIEEHLI